MSTELSTTRKPEVIANEIVRLSNRMLEDAIEVGRRFVELKAAVPYGEWGKWLEYTGYKKSSANNMMALFEAYGAEELSLFGNVKSQTFGKLGYSKALALLAVPEEEREEFAEKVDAEHLSVRQLKAEIKARDEKLAEAQNQADGWKLKYEKALNDAEVIVQGAATAEALHQAALKKAKEAERAAADAKADADLAREEADKRGKELALSGELISGLQQEKQQLTERIVELESQPVDVAVQSVDATAEQLAEAEARGRTQGLNEAADKMEAAEKRWRDLNAKLTAERDEANDTAACLEKQLEEAEAKAAKAENPQQEAIARMMGEINGCFKTMQIQVNEITGLLQQLDDVSRERARGALIKALRGLADQLEANA